jgi:hypothetical protein
MAWSPMSPSARAKPSSSAFRTPGARP